MTNENQRALVKVSVEDTLTHFQEFSREPFQNLLTYLMQYIPDETSLQEFANQSPDKWAKMIEIFAKLSGYHEKVEVSSNVSVEINRLSDSELLRRAEENARVLETIEAKFETIEEGDDLPGSSPSPGPASDPEV